MSNTQINLYLLSTLFFFFIFGWKITPILDLSVIMTIPVYMFVVTRPSIISASLRQSFSITLIFTLLTAYCLVSLLAHDTSSAQWLLRTIRASVTFGACFLVVYMQTLKNGAQAKDILTKAVAIAITAHAAITISSQLYAPFRHSIYAMTNAELYVNEIAMIMDNRPFGLTYSLSITSFLYFIASAILLRIKAENTTQNIAKLLAVALNTVACLWVARTGLVFFPLLLLLLVPQIRGYQPKQFIAATSGLVCAIAGSIYIANLEPVQATMLFFRLGELLTFFSFSEENRFAQQFLTMFHLPTEINQLLLGNSLTGREQGHYVTSDVGYVLTIYGLGIIGQILMLLPVLTGMYASAKVYKSQKQYGLLAMIILSSYLVLNIKELALMTRTVWPVICVFLSISLIEYHALRKRQNDDKKERQAL